jgi:hypothetical protein
MTVASMFFIFAIAIMAPHIPANDAKLISVGCTAIAVVFGIIEWRLK